MATVQNAIDYFQEIYPECDETRALRYLNRVNKRLLGRLPFRNSTEDITLTSGTRKYDLSANTIKIWAAEYIRTSADDDFYHLTERNVDEMDILWPGWRSLTNQSSSTPDTYFVDTATSSDSAKMQVGFYPTPPTSTSGGYPKVRLYVTTMTDYDTTDTVPTDLLDEEVFVAGMCYFWSLRRDKEKNEFWKIRFEEEIHKNIVHLQTLMARDNFEISFDFTRSMGRVI